VRRVAAAEAPLDGRGGLIGDRGLWRFQPGRLMPGPMITFQEPRREEPDQGNSVQRDAICPIGGVIWGKVGRPGCDGDSRTPWRAEARGDKTRQRQRRAVRVMVPWPAVG